jgi:pSer/pThr/pTyr-binding forkhead associated (FHA) protein
MVDGALERGSAFRVGLGVSGEVIVSGSCDHPSHSCDGWVCDLGVVDDSSIFGLVRGAGAFAAVLLTFVLVSRMHLVQQYRGNGHFLSTSLSSRHEVMVSGTLTRVSALSVGLGVSGATIVSGSCARPSHAWISRLLTSSLSLGISGLFCRTTQCV